MGVRLVDVPPAIAGHWENLNGSGQTGDRLCAELGTNALRFGHTFNAG